MFCQSHRLSVGMDRSSPSGSNAHTITSYAICHSMPDKSHSTDNWSKKDQDKHDNKLRYLSHRTARLMPASRSTLEDESLIDKTAMMKLGWKQVFKKDSKRVNIENLSRNDFYKALPHGYQSAGLEETCVFIH